MSKRKSLLSKGYSKFLSEIKGKIVSARIRAARSLNKELIQLYWDLGGIIVRQQKKHGWGKSVVERLAGDLKEEFGSTHGFSTQNLWYMRQFYLEYKNESNLQQLVGEIPWGHNILIFSKVKDFRARAYYLRAAEHFGWSRNVLLNQIKADAYRLHLEDPKRHNFAEVLPAHLAEQVDESIKDVYNLDFLGITKPVLERQLEKRLTEKVKQFILELGHGFSFIGNQYRLEIGGNDYSVDLLFFNRILRCLVAIELKTGKFEPEYAGKMDFYLNLLNDKVKLRDENPSVGIILCAEKNNVVVEYALRSVRNPVGVAQYRLTTKLPQNFKKVLPSKRELIQQVEEELK